MSLHLLHPASPSALPAIVGATSPTMSSREIAELLGKRHDSVKRTIDRLAERGVVALPPTVEASFKDSLGKTQHTTEYLIGKRDSYVIAAQISPEFTARLVDRWQELEAAAVAHPVPKSFADALQLAADQARQIEQQGAQIAELAPKAVALDRIANTDGLILISNAAKTLQIEVQALFAWLMANRWIFRRGGSKRYIGFAERLRAGYLKHKYDAVPMPDGTTAQKERVFLTPKGVARLAVIFGREVKS